MKILIYSPSYKFAHRHLSIIIGEEAASWQDVKVRRFDNKAIIDYMGEDGNYKCDHYYMITDLNQLDELAWLNIKWDALHVDKVGVPKHHIQRFYEEHDECPIIHFTPME